MSIADRLRALEPKLRDDYYRLSAIDELKALADEVERLEQDDKGYRHALTYALNAIDEHMVGTDIDWLDVRRVLAKALGEESCFDHPFDCQCFICTDE